MNQPFITAAALQTQLASAAPLLLCDCSFDLADPGAGARAHALTHLPGALYLNLDDDLSAPKSGAQPGRGRHPLPDRQAFAQRLAALGFQDDLPVVAYDRSGGMYAARLWWMLRWAGHDAVQVLDGGLAAWDATGAALQSGPVTARAAGRFTLRPALTRALNFGDVLAGLGRGSRLIVDARAADRFRGENETLDPVGGHIPGAVNRCFRDNLGPDGCFQSPEALRAQWSGLMAGRSPTDLVMQCGSGVTACHNLLALEAAGLGGAALYPGSWSEWCAQAEAPVAVGG
jgi:thiosulfate/3-mercaptopyruvate sulfurtransferase